MLWLQKLARFARNQDEDVLVFRPNFSAKKKMVKIHLSNSTQGCCHSSMEIQPSEERLNWHSTQESRRKVSVSKTGLAHSWREWRKVSKDRRDTVSASYPFR